MGTHLRRARSLVVLTVVVAAMLSGAPGAQAALTSPTDGEIVDGTIDLVETVGGTNTCPAGYDYYGGTDFRVVNAEGEYVAWFSDNRYPRGGPRTQAWATDTLDWSGERYWPNGTYTVQSVARNAYWQYYGSGWGGYYTCVQYEYLISSATITVRNFDFAFTDDLGGGTVKMNISPVEHFRFEPTGGPKYFREDAVAMETYSLPSTVTPDLTCAGGDATTCVPEPPAEATLCTAQTQDCKARLVKISLDDAELTIHGLFDLGSGAFIAVAQEKASGKNTVLSHGPSCATGPDGEKRCASDREPQCVPDPTTGEPVCIDPSGVPAGIPPVPPAPPVPPVPPAPPIPQQCVFHPVTGEPVCVPA